MFDLLILHTVSKNIWTLKVISRLPMFYSMFWFLMFWFLMFLFLTFWSFNILIILKILFDILTLWCSDFWRSNPLPVKILEIQTFILQGLAKQMQVYKKYKITGNNKLLLQVKEWKNFRTNLFFIKCLYTSI
jgi:hypothetical protein